MVKIKNNTKKSSYKHLSLKERQLIEVWHNMGDSNREIGRWLGRHHQTINNELKRGTTTQIKENKKAKQLYFADPGTPSQRGLNENSNGLLRKDGLPKKMDFNEVDESFIQSVASKRNNIPRKSLNYKTPLEVFLSYVDNDILSSLIWQMK